MLDQLGDIDSRKSTTSYIFSLSRDLATNNIVSWNSMLQKSVALSTCEAEYIAIKEAIREAIYLANLFNYLNDRLGLGYTPSKPTILVDNKAAIKLAENPEFHKRTKHIDIQYHYIRDQVKQKRVDVQYVPTKLQLADFLTKNVRREIFEDLKNLANLREEIQEDIYLAILQQYIYISILSTLLISILYCYLHYSIKITGEYQILGKMPKLDSWISIRYQARCLSIQGKDDKAVRQHIKPDS